MTWMIVALVLPVGIAGYAYWGYPLILVILARLRGRRDLKNAPVDWPAIPSSCRCMTRRRRSLVLGDVEGLRDAMQSLLESPERARTGVRITAAVVSQRFGAEPRLDRVHAVYRETWHS